MNKIKRFLLNDKGATAIEYAFIASMVSITIAAALLLIGDGMEIRYQSIADAFS